MQDMKETWGLFKVNDFKRCEILTYVDEGELDLEVCSIVERIPFQQTGDLVTYPWPSLYQHFYYNTRKISFTISKIRHFDIWKIEMIPNFHIR